MNPARVKSEQKRCRYFAKLYRNARVEALREAAALVALLESGASLRKIHFAAHDLYMATGLLYGEAAWLAYARKSTAAAKAGKRMRRSGGLSEKLGWPDPGDAYNARKKAQAAA
jgi:hypothetical protein